jgi:hypothetical protein
MRKIVLLFIFLFPLFDAVARSLGSGHPWHEIEELPVLPQDQAGLLYPEIKDVWPELRADNLRTSRFIQPEVRQVWDIIKQRGEGPPTCVSQLLRLLQTGQKIIEEKSYRIAELHFAGSPEGISRGAIVEGLGTSRGTYRLGGIPIEFYNFKIIDMINNGEGEAEFALLQFDTFGRTVGGQTQLTDQKRIADLSGLGPPERLSVFEIRDGRGLIPQHDFSVVTVVLQRKSGSLLTEASWVSEQKRLYPTDIDNLPRNKNDVTLADREEFYLWSAAAISFMHAPNGTTIYNSVSRLPGELREYLSGTSGGYVAESGAFICTHGNRICRDAEHHRERVKAQILEGQRRVIRELILKPRIERVEGEKNKPYALPPFLIDPDWEERDHAGSPG